MKKRVLVTGGSGFIGTHLIEALKSDDLELLNIDIEPPKLKEHERFWRACDITDSALTLGSFSVFQPTHVIHLAAKANLQGTTVDDFPSNVVGTANVIKGVNETPSVVRFGHVSTQYVVTPGVRPVSDEHLEPYTAYGESKAEGERLVRRDCRMCWVILRPTNIWGPMHPFFPSELWRYLEKRYYLHPGNAPITKHYGYVENAVDQIVALVFHGSPDQVLGRTFYITDGPIDNADWMNGFSRRLCGRPIRRAPMWIWRSLAVTGDALNRFGVRFPVSSARLFRLSVGENLPFERTMQLTGKPKVSLEEGIDRSVQWYRQQA